MDIFWNYSLHLAKGGHRWKKRVLKFLQQINLLTGQKYKYSYCKCKLQIYNYYKCLPSECSLATDSDKFIFCKHYFSRIMFMFYIFVFFVGIKWWEWCYMSSWTMHQISTCPYEKVWQGQKELITFQLLVGLTHKTLMSVSLNKGNLGTKRGNSVWFAPTYDLQVRSAVVLLINQLWTLHRASCGQYCVADRVEGRTFNPSNRKIKIWILICCPYSFPIDVVSRSW